MIAFLSLDVKFYQKFLSKLEWETALGNISLRLTGTGIFRITQACPLLLVNPIELKSSSYGAMPSCMFN